MIVCVCVQTREFNTKTDVLFCTGHVRTCLTIFKSISSQGRLPVQCDQSGRLWNFVVTNFIAKVAQMFGNFLGSCKNHCFLSQTGESTFWATFGKNLGDF